MSYIIKEIDYHDIISGQASIPEFADRFSIDHVTGRLMGKDVYAYGVFDSNGIMAGFSVAYNKDSDDVLYCWLAGVLPKHRQRGLYAQLAGHREAWAKSHGYKALTIKTYNRYRAMLSFLIQNGWDLTAIKICNRTGENAIYARKNLI